MTFTNGICVNYAAIFCCECFQLLEMLDIGHEPDKPDEFIVGYRPCRAKSSARTGALQKLCLFHSFQNVKLQ